MKQNTRDTVVIGLLSLIAVLALIAATRTLPAPPVPQYDSLETTIRQVLEQCEMKDSTPRQGSIFLPAPEKKWAFECVGY